MIRSFRHRGLKRLFHRGDRKGYWSVRVSGNGRIIFRFENEDAHDIELIDYH